MKVSVSTNTAAIVAEIVGEMRPVFRPAIARSVNRATDGARTAANREIRTRYKVRMADVNKAFSIQRATPETLRASLRASGRPLPLIAFAARQTKKGVTVDVKGTRKLIPSAFITKVRNGHEGVFVRKGRSRLPIRELYTVSVPGMFRQDDVLKAITPVTTERFERELRHELERFKAKGQKRG